MATIGVVVKLQSSKAIQARQASFDVPLIDFSLIDFSLIDVPLIDVPLIDVPLIVSRSATAFYSPVRKCREQPAKYQTESQRDGIHYANE